MCISRSKLTVLFDAPFWVLLYERESQGCYEACRIIFGAEPTDQQVYEYLMEHWRDLSFSPAIMIATERESERQIQPINPKRRQREARKQTSAAKNHAMNTIGTKAQQALKLQREQGKQIRQTRSREQKQADAARKRKILENKRKEKHRGH